MGLAYSENHRGEAGAYQGGVSSAPGWSIRWQGPYNVGPLPIDVVRAARDNLKHRQRTTASTEENAKLLFKLEQAIEEYEGKSPTIGGDLNNLIPEGE